ncbi:MAG: GNAT family N-acetyltransferase [Brachybacterium sp.]|nr:GNAT family N-acetyltransferase [Brachybacterium sp.]
MTLDAARVIADTWKYPEPYNFYDATADAEDYQDYQELITPSMWPDSFWQVRHEGELVGFFTADATEDGEACEISLGLRPDLTGGGRGSAFLTAGLKQLHRSEMPDRLVLSVAAFNIRAISAYEGAGFENIERYVQRTNGGVHDFVRMELRSR